MYNSKKKICFCPGHTDSSSVRGLAGSWTHSCKVFHSSIAGKGVDSGLMSKWQQHNSVGLQSSYSWFTLVQERAPACSHSPSLVLLSQLWFFMMNNKKILLRIQLLHAWCRVELQVHKPWDFMPQGVGHPSHVSQASEPSSMWDCTPGDSLFFGDHGQLNSALKRAGTNELREDYFILCSH